MPKVHRTDGAISGHAIESYLFYCPGCKCHHGFITKNIPGGPEWEFNGDINNPTFSPSLIVQDRNDFAICHLFVRNGKIEFLGDCTHELAGKTVDMPNER